MPEPPRALLVDLDDTILAYSAAGATTWRAVSEAFAAHLDWDIAPALSMGMTAIWVDHAGRGLPADTRVQPSRTIASLMELL